MNIQYIYINNYFYMRLDFHLICKLGEGTFSEVMKVKHKKSGRIFAMKKFRKHYMRLEEFEYLFFNIIIRFIISFN